MRCVFAFVCLALAAALPVQAEEPAGPELIELFSSQNCRACPKAHETLKAVNAARNDVLILTWSVDYWDYLGGDDPMAMEESKARQAAYVERFRLRGPYTPQTVYNGVKQCAGNKPSRVNKALAEVAEISRAPVRLRRDGDTVHLSGTPGELTDILLVNYLGGEANTTDMVNPVTKMRVLAPWIGGAISFDRSECPGTCAVIIQGAATGPVLAALDLGTD